MKITSIYRKCRYQWPDNLPDPPRELVELIERAMIDFGPDRHCDGAQELAAIALDWFTNRR